MRPSTLSKLADEDWDANVPDPSPDDGVDRLSAAWLKSVYTAFLVHEGKRFVVRGAVIDERGLLPDECDRLGAQMGIAARFRVAIVRTGSPMSITVVTTSALLTSRCQEASRGRMIAEWTVELRTFDEPSFWTWESPTRRPWVLLVVAIR